MASAASTVFSSSALMRSLTHYTSDDVVKQRPGGHRIEHNIGTQQYESTDEACGSLRWSIKLLDL